MKGTFIVLRRLRGGDADLLATLYGTPGKVSLLLRDGFLNSNPFFGIFEPFNYVEIDYTQIGSLLVPNDVMSVERISLLARSYKRYLYMSGISLFIIKYVNYYDEAIFRLILKYLTKEVKNPEVNLIKFKLDFLKAYGILPKFLNKGSIKGERVRIKLSTGDIREDGEYEMEGYLAEFLRKLFRMKNPERLNLTRKDVRKTEEFLKEYLKFHLKD